MLARVTPFALYMVFLVLADGLRAAGIANDALRWIYPVQVGAVAFALAYFRREYAELLVSRRLVTIDWLLGVLAGVVVFALWIHLDYSWMLVGQSAGFDPRNNGAALDWPLVIARLVGAALIVPVMEELFWRSFLMRWLADRDFITVNVASVGATALLISSLLFAVEHTQWFAGLMAGLVYGGLYIGTRNLKVPVIAHAVTNGLLGVWVLYSENWNYW